MNLIWQMNLYIRKSKIVKKNKTEKKKTTTNEMRKKLIYHQNGNILLRWTKCYYLDVLSKSILHKTLILP